MVLLVLLPLWGLALVVGWVRVDLWLRSVAPPIPAEADAIAGRRLWLSGRRATTGPVWVVVGGAVLLTAGLKAWWTGWAPALLLAAVSALLIWLLPLVFLRFALRKQFPHLTPHLPGWWER